MSTYKEIGDLKLCEESPDYGDYGEYLSVSVEKIKELGHLDDDIRIVVFPDQADRMSITLSLRVPKAKELALLLEKAIKYAESPQRNNRKHWKQVAQSKGNSK
jgi:hypothetical protein